jgi:lipopolysaccharide export system permease protein
MHIKGYPKTLHRYIFKEIIKPFVGGIVFFLFVLMMFQVIRLSDFFVIHNVSAKIIFTLMYYLSFTFVPIVIPIAFLLAVLLGFGRLSADAEITAMRASGLSVYSLTVPAVTFGGLLCLTLMLANFYFVPWANRMFRYELFRISNTKAIATIHEGTFTEGFFDLVVYADSTDSKNNTMERVLIYDERRPSDPITVVAKHGQLIGNYQDDDGSPGVLLRLFDGNLQKTNAVKAEFELIEFKVYDVFLKIETGKFGGIEKPKSLDIGDLKNKINELQRLYMVDISPERKAIYFADLNQHTVEYWKRFALAISCLLFGVMGVAFGVIRTRTVRSNSFLICLLVLLFYWGIYTAGESMAISGKVPALLGVWAANVILLIISVYSLHRVAK